MAFLPSKCFSAFSCWSLTLAPSVCICWAALPRVIPKRALAIRNWKIYKIWLYLSKNISRTKKIGSGHQAGQAYKRICTLYRPGTRPWTKLLLSVFSFHSISIENIRWVNDPTQGPRFLRHGDPKKFWRKKMWCKKWLFLIKWTYIFFLKFIK